MATPAYTGKSTTSVDANLDEGCPGTQPDVGPVMLPRGIAELIPDPLMADSRRG